MRVVKRIEDMSPRGYLQVRIAGDGDIHVAVYPEENGLVDGPFSVEFCAIGTGGGRSQHTLAALRALADAMERDNEERPIFDRQGGGAA